MFVEVLTRPEISMPPTVPPWDEVSEAMANLERNDKSSADTTDWVSGIGWSPSGVIGWGI
jgi:hypothetical protein